ncbi:MAG: hypothetical protein NZL85_11240, partial [Fimbriimonadales bacterium]|nr:hypothetical protein [Fimbriimonadales bacterium]
IYQRAMARVMVALAAERERRGRVREGLAIRLALAEYGGRVRSQAPWLIQALVGVAITQIAGAAPGGERAQPPPQLTSEEKKVWRTQRFLQYLRARGFQREANWFAAEYRRADALVAQTRQAVNRFYDETLIPMMRRHYGWLFSLFFTLGLLWSLGWMWLALGVAARGHLSLPAALMIALGVMLLATLWLTASASGEMMWRVLDSARAAELWFREATNGATQEEITRLSRLWRWGLPLSIYLIDGLLLGLGLIWLAATRRLAAEQSVLMLWRFTTVVGLVLLLALNGLMIAQVRLEKQLEQFAAMMRQNEVQLYLQGKRVPFEPPPR